MFVHLFMFSIRRWSNPKTQIRKSNLRSPNMDDSRIQLILHAQNPLT